MQHNISFKVARIDVLTQSIAEIQAGIYGMTIVNTLTS